MSLLRERQSSIFSCPRGGTWYACGYDKFVGCCDDNVQGSPCDLGCFDGNVKPASFVPSYWGKFSDMLCANGKAYQCRDTNPSFVGCCRSDPCNETGGFPTGNVTAGRLPSNTAFYLPTAMSTSTSTSAMSTGLGSLAFTTTDPVESSYYSPTVMSASASTSTTSTGLGLSVPATTDPGQNHTPVAAVAGAAAGGAIALALIVGLIIWRVRAHKSKSRRSPNTVLDNHPGPLTSPIQDTHQELSAMSEISPGMLISASPSSF